MIGCAKGHNHPMEKWTNDNIPVSGETFREFVKKLYQGNELVRGEFRPSGSEREWCDPEVLRLLRRRSLARLRRDGRESPQRPNRDVSYAAPER